MNKFMNCKIIKEKLKACLKNNMNFYKKYKNIKQKINRSVNKIRN